MRERESERDIEKHKERNEAWSDMLMFSLAVLAVSRGAIHRAGQINLKSTTHQPQ